MGLMSGQTRSGTKSLKKYNLHIETERLLLRPFNEGDIDVAYKMNLDTKVNKYTGDGGVVSKSEIKRRITKDVMGDYNKYGYGRLAVEIKSTNQFIGFCGLKYLDDLQVVDLGFRFMSQYWGKGYATESSRAAIRFGFKKLKLNDIYAFVLNENVNSIHVLEKLGFVYEKQIIDLGSLANQYKLSQNILE